MGTPFVLDTGRGANQPRTRTPPQNPTLKTPAPYLQLILAAVFWGGTFVAGRQLAPLIDPVPAAFMRFVLASSMLLGWLYWQLGRFPALSRRQFVGVGLLGATGILAYNLFFFSGLETVEAGRAALIIALNPVMIAIASALLFRERLSPQQLLGAVLSVCGAVIVIGRGDLPTLLSGGIGSGEWLLLGCVVSWVAYTLIGKRLLRRLSPLVAVSYSSLAGTLMLGVVFAWRGDMATTPLSDATVWVNIAYLALFGTVLAFVWFYKGVHALGATRAGQFINLVPVSGVCLAVLLLDEPLTSSLISGGMLVILGLWLTNRPQPAQGTPPGG